MKPIGVSPSFPSGPVYRLFVTMSGYVEKERRRERKRPMRSPSTVRGIRFAGGEIKKKKEKTKEKLVVASGKKEGREAGANGAISNIFLFFLASQPLLRVLSLSPSSPRTRILIFRNSSRDAGERARKAHRPRRSGETRRIGEGGRSSVRTTHDRGGDGHLRARASERTEGISLLDANESMLFTRAR